MSQALVSQIEERLFRLNLIPLIDLRQQVRFTYWSELHFLPKALIDFLPFGSALGPIKFYELVDYQFARLINLSRQAKIYWTLNPTHSYNQTLVQDITLSFDDTFFWHYYIPAKTQEITESLLQGNRIRFLSRFHLSETEIKVEFQEVRLQITDQGTKLIGALGKEYTYLWEQAAWNVTRLNTEGTIVNPLSFYYPPTEPNAQGRESEY